MKPAAQTEVVIPSYKRSQSELFVFMSHDLAHRSPALRRWSLYLFVFHGPLFSFPPHISFPILIFPYSLPARALPLLIVCISCCMSPLSIIIQVIWNHMSVSMSVCLSAPDHVTVAQRSATPESGCTLTNSRTDDDIDNRSVDFDGAVQTCLSAA